VDRPASTFAKKPVRDFGSLSTAHFVKSHGGARSNRLWFRDYSVSVFSATTGVSADLCANNKP